MGAPSGLYTILIKGRLGATALSAFPSMVSELKGGEAVLTARIGPRCSASLRRSKPSASTCSNSDKCGRDRNRLNQAMTAHQIGV